MKEGFRLPTNRQRVAIMGRTGSGKTQQGTWLISEAPFDHQPYIVVDYKGDDLLNSIDRIKEIGLNEVPKHPGLYIIHPRPDDADDMEKWLSRIWERGSTGLYFDEAYMLPAKGAFQAILTQGRSKHIPAICLTQRPSWISRFVFSEADFYSIFHLNDMRDRQTVQAFVPKDRLDVHQRLDDYNSWWYDVGRDKVFSMLPVPDADTIANKINDRLRPKRRNF